MADQNPLDAALSRGSDFEPIPGVTPPAGFTLDKPAPSTPVPPAGFTLDSGFEAIPGIAPAKKTRTTEPDKAWYSKAWDWANEPLWHINKTNRGGFIGGTEDVASGFTSPLSIGLTAATLGSGALLRGLGIAAEELPVVVRGVKALIGAGFTYQQASQAIHESPRVLDALKEGDYETAKRLAVHVAASGIGAALGAREVVPEARSLGEKFGVLKPQEGFTPARRELGRYLADRTSNAQEAKLFDQNAREALEDTDKVTLGAISRYIEAGGSKSVLRDRAAKLAASDAVRENYTAKQRADLLAKYDRAQKLTPEEADFADKIRGQLADNFALAHQHGIINNAVENYISHVWEEDKNPAVNRTLHQAGSGQFQTSPSVARQRVFDTSFEGEMLGKKLKSDDPIALTASHTSQVKNAIAARNFLERLRDVQASDGRPMTALAGAGTTLGDVTLVRPGAMRNVRISDATVKALKQAGTFDDMLQAGQIEPLNPEKFGQEAFAWNPGDYRAIDHPAFRDWGFAANDPSGNPVLVKSDLRVHPEAADFVARAIGAEKSAFRENPITNLALKASSQAKGALLSLSPFHVVQEGLRAVMTGINPFGVDRWNLDADPVLRAGVEHGLTLGKDYRGLSDFTEGVSGGHSIIEKIPGIGPLQTQLHKFLFDDYIPSLKARAYRSLVERYAKASPDWSAEKVQSEAASDTNARFGGINYRYLGRSLSSQDAMRLATLAPDWLESEIRFMARALNPTAEGKIARMDLARIGLYTFAAARVLNMLESGKPRLDAPFGVVVPNDDGKDTVFSFRTPLSDLGHVLSDPTEFLRGRSNPLLLRSGIEAFTGRDAQGRRVTPGGQVMDLAKNVTPIPVQGLLEQAATGTRPEMDTVGQVARAFGANVYLQKTEAEKLASALASDRTPTGPVDEDKLERHLRKIKIEDQLRAYRVPNMDEFSPREREEMMKTARSTTGLQARFARLPMPDALRVWDIATEAERVSLVREFLKKKRAYVRKAHQDMTPDERKKDPTFQRLLKMVPDN